MTTLERPTTTEATDRSPRRRVPPPAGVAVTVVSAGIFLWLCWVLRGFVTDDAWISVRYAENLANGHGFVWNPGGPRAEGFSNPLLVGIEALADVLGLPALRTARALGVLCGLACLVLVYVKGRAVVGEFAAASATLLIGCSAPFALWAVGGLETLPVALVLTFAVLELARADRGRVWVAGSALALLPWLRPEGLAAVAAVVFFSEAAGLLRRATRMAAVRRALVLGGVPVAAQLLLEAVRLGVYGHLLPNSVLYKSGQGELLTVLEKFVGQGALVLAMAVAGAVLARGRQRLLCVPPAVYLLGSLGTLDSVNAFSRFFMPIWPLVALLAGVAAAGLVTAVAERRRVAAAGALVAATGLALVVVSPVNIRAVDAFADEYMSCKADARSRMAGWLRTTDPGTTFSISDAGLVPARAGGRTAVDQLLLNDPLIQETGALPVDRRADLVHEQEPDVLVLYSRDPNVFAAAYPTDQAIHDHPAADDYRLVYVAAGGGPGCTYHLMAFAR
jgi:hypothetical protein